ncbi:ALG9 [Symbiodinium sp. CCMP2456]|nr:ALG9 [Symbiodinium sp. CCMP2456]
MPQVALSPEIARMLEQAPGLTSRNATANEAEKSAKPDADAASPHEVMESSPRPKSEAKPNRNRQVSNTDEDLDVWIHSQYYARGGQKKKALQALSRHQTGTSVHQVPEVRKINACTSRLGVKLEYFRDHTDEVESLMRVVEEGFMYQETSCGEPLVNVAKLRSRGLKVKETDLERGGRPRSQASGRTSPTRACTPRVRTPPCVRLREVVLRARDAELERRVDQALRIRSRQTRHLRAQRERPWLTFLLLALTSKVLQKLVTVHRQIRHAVCGDSTQAIRMYRDDFRQICLERGEDLSLFTNRHFEAVQTHATHLCDLELQRRRSLSIWTAWKKMLRLLVVYIRLRRPLRKAAAAEALKSFIGASARAYLLRRAVKHFVRSVLLVQKAMRHQARIFRTIQNYILKPYLWCAETLALCDTCRVRKAEASARIEAFLEEADVERWKDEVKQMMLQRARAWREDYANAPPPGRRNPEDDSLNILPSQSEVRQQMTLAAATLVDSRASKRFRNSDRDRAAQSDAMSRTSRKTLVFSKHFDAMDRLRLDSRERDEIARKVLLRIIDAWWNSMCFYGVQAERSKNDWISWRQEVLRHGSLDSRAPDPPDVLVCPEISFSQAYTWLQKEVDHRYRDRLEQVEASAMKFHRTAKMHVADFRCKAAVVLQMPNSGMAVTDGKPTGTFSASAANAKGDHTGSSMFGSWLRDNCIIAWGLFYTDPEGPGSDDAVACLTCIARFLLKYQSHKMEMVINGLKDVKGGEKTWMDRPHIRFIGETGLEDPKWYNHKQNDALGYFMWARTQLAWHKKLPFDGEHLKLMGQMFDYLRAIECWEDLDGGHWEEHSAVHASSVGPPLAAVKLFKKVAARDGFLPPCKSDTLDVLESNLQSALGKILPNEIIFPTDLARDSDSATVFLAYPLEVVDDASALQIMDRLKKVMGHIGMCRYRKDSYWCKDYKEKVGDDPTKHFTDEELKERDRLLKEGEEAQWCLFDPMVSAFYGRMYQKTKDAKYLTLQQLFLARSLAAITGDSCPYGPWHCAEAYYLEKDTWVPNDDTPLVWTQVDLKMALFEMERSLALVV